MSSRAVTLSLGNPEARQRMAIALIATFFTAGVLAVWSTTAAAQQPKYEVAELDAKFTDEKMVKRMQSSLRGYATTRDPAGYAGKRAADFFIQRYVPARITDPAAAGEIADLVSTTMDAVESAQRAKSPAAMEITGAAYRSFRSVAEGNFYPPARIAATIALGRLDLGAPSPNELPRIIPQVVGLLVDLYADESNDDGIRAAALQGIHRQLTIGMDRVAPEVKAKLVEEMTKLIDAPVPPTRSAEAHAFLQRYGVDLLAMLKGENDEELASKLVSISTEAGRPNLIALYSASRIAGMKDALAGKVDAPALVLDKWSARLWKAFQEELDRLEKLDPPVAASGQPPKPREVLRQKTEAPKTSSAEYGDAYGEAMDEGMEGYDMEGMDMEDPYGGDMMFGPGMADAKPQPPEVLASRRHLNHLLQQIHRAVTGSSKPGIPDQAGGLLAAVDQAERGVIEGWVTEMETLVTTVNDEFLDDREKFMEMLTEQILVLEELSGDEAKAPGEIPEPVLEPELAPELPLTDAAAE